MMNKVSFLWYLIPILIFGQSDKIELPDIELTIKDHSMINPESAEDLLLKERNPQFQEVYLEELVAHIEDATFEAAISHRRLKKTQFSILYGSYNTAQVNLLAQDLVKNLYYYMSYFGEITDNIAYKGHQYLNTGRFHNNLQSHISYNLRQAIIDLHIDYDQVKNSFFSHQEHSQYVHYIPLCFSTRYWVNDFSYLHFFTNVRSSILENRTLEGVKTRSGYLLDSQFHFSYNANFAEWNFFTLEPKYWLNVYDNKVLIHNGGIDLRSDFFLGKGWTLDLGMSLYISSQSSFYGWPEIKLAYSYLEKITVDFKCSGHYDMLSGENTAGEIQFFDLSPLTEKKFIYALSAQFHPNAFVWMSTRVAYDYYFSRRKYEYNPQLELYRFSLSEKTGFWNVGCIFGSEYADILQFIVEYAFENFSKDWLLYPTHKLDLMFMLGYKKIGLMCETHFVLYSERYLTLSKEAPVSLLLSFKISQKIYNRVELFVEVRNILNQDIQFVAGTIYGGVQAYGGIQVVF